MQFKPSLTRSNEKKMKKMKKKFQNFLAWGGPQGYPISGPPDQISKNRPVIHLRIIKEGFMQNFIKIGPVVCPIEGLR